MADRRTDDQPLAPRRPLTGPSTSQPSNATTPTGKNVTQGTKQANAEENTESSPRPGEGTTKGPADSDSKPTQPAAKPGEGITRPGEAAGRPSGPEAKPTEVSARPVPPRPGGAQGAPAPGAPVANKPGVTPSTSGQQGNKPGVTPSSSSQTRDSQGTRAPVTERVSQKVSQAVTAATETVRSATETRGRAPERRPVPPTGNRPGSGSTRPRTRKARLRMTHIDPWSVMKTSFLLSIALGIVTVIAVAMVWSVLGAAGVWDSINKTVQEVIGGGSGSAFNVEDYVGTSRVLGFTMIVAVVDVVLITAIATLGAFLYNLAATLLGGVEVTLAEEEH